MVRAAVLVVASLAVVAVRPQDDELQDDQYVPPGSELHFVGSHLKANSTLYNPDTQNLYHLFTRKNPTVSQPIMLGNTDLLNMSNYNSNKRTIVLIHGWNSGRFADLNSVLVPAFLKAEDVNVIAVDWTAGSDVSVYFIAVGNVRTGGEGVARFINWLNNNTGSVPAQYHIVGHSLGAHMSGIVGRNMNARPAYITALEPALPGFADNPETFRADDGIYTEVIHTNAGQMGFISNLGQVDFYPNGGSYQPGCKTSDCNHRRSYRYFSESLTSGGFTGHQCASHVYAMIGHCDPWGSLKMGGIVPKNGHTGNYYLETNPEPPYSKG